MRGCHTTRITCCGVGGGSDRSGVRIDGVKSVETDSTDEKSAENARELFRGVESYSVPLYNINQIFAFHSKNVSWSIRFYFNTLMTDHFLPLPVPSRRPTHALCDRQLGHLLEGVSVEEVQVAERLATLQRCARHHQLVVGTEQAVGPVAAHRAEDVRHRAQGGDCSASFTNITMTAAIICW